MTDFADDSQRWIDAEEAETLRRARLDVGESSYQCYNCMEVIPEKRRTAYPGVRYCVECQSEREGRR